MSEKWERWTKKELAILKSRYHNTPREDLMHLLPGRTWRAIGHIAEKQKVHRHRHDIPKSPERTATTHANCSIARCNRTKQPFAGKHHTTEAKLHISVSNLHASGHSIADIAGRNHITETEVKNIIEEKK